LWLGWPNYLRTDLNFVRILWNTSRFLSGKPSPPPTVVPVQKLASKSSFFTKFKCWVPTFTSHKDLCFFYQSQRNQQNKVDNWLISTLKYFLRLYFWFIHWFLSSLGLNNIERSIWLHFSPSLPASLSLLLVYWRISVCFSIYDILLLRSRNLFIQAWFPSTQMLMNRLAHAPISAGIDKWHVKCWKAHQDFHR